MPAMTESCSVCAKRFDVQFRYQMEERDGGFAFYCSQACNVQAVRGETTGAPRARRATSASSWTSSHRSCGSAASCDTPAPRGAAANPGGGRRRAPRRLRGARARQGRPAALPIPADRPQANATVPQKGGAARAGWRSSTTRVARARRRRRSPLRPGLAARGLRVLLVDTDSQGNVCVSLGVKADKTLYHVLVMVNARRSGRRTCGRIWIFIASNETLAAAELYLAGRQNRDRVLRDRLASALGGYDASSSTARPRCRS